MNNIKVIKIPVDSDPMVVDIPNTLEAMQEMVGGFIQIVQLSKGLDLCCNEEGKLLKLPLNVTLFGGKDVVAGDCFLLRHDSEGDAISVTKADINKYVGRGRVHAV